MMRGPPPAEIEPHGHVASTPESPSHSAGMIGQERREQGDGVLHDREASARAAGTWPISQPTARPTATPPAPVTRNRSAAWPAEKDPVSAAATPSRYATSAVASLTSPSPSRMVVSTRRAPMVRITAIAATGSGGETMAAEDERGGPRELGGERVRHHRDGHDGEQDHQRAEAGDRPEVQPEVAERGVERAPVEQRGDEEEEERVGVELDPGEPGHEHQPQPREDEQHRMRHPKAPGHQSQGRRDGEQDDDELYAAHGSDQLLAAVDVEGRPGQRGVGHEVDGERGDVGGADDAADRQRVAQLLAARVELVAEQ